MGYVRMVPRLNLKTYLVLNMSFSVEVRLLLAHQQFKNLLINLMKSLLLFYPYFY